MDNINNISDAELIELYKDISEFIKYLEKSNK